MTAGEADQQARIPTLRDLTEKKAAELAQTISLYKAGKQDAAKAMVLSGCRPALSMNSIQQLISQMINSEVSLEASRATRYKASIRNSIASIYLSSLIAIIGLILLAYYIIRQIELRESDSALDIRVREEWFRVTLTSIGHAVIATDPKGNVTFLNPVAEKLTGTTLDNAKGRLIQDVFPIYNEHTLKEAENPVSKVLSLGRVVGLANHTVLRNIEGILIPIEDSAAPILGMTKSCWVWFWYFAT